jgi:hypothetical protein
MHDQSDKDISHYGPAADEFLKRIMQDPEMLVLQQLLTSIYPTPVTVLQ